MENGPLVSIITVCYNSEKYIEDTIESVLNQTYDNIEYIIIDGQSEDRTLDIIKKYEPKFNGRMKWISEKDAGIYNAMNKGIKMASGEIIGIINSDDWYNSEAIEMIIKNYQKDIDIYHGDQYMIKEANGNYYKKLKKAKKLSLLKKEMVINHPTCFIRKNWYEKYFLFDEEYEVSSDYKFMLESFLKGANFKHIEYPFVFMRAGGVSSGLKGKIEVCLIQKELLNNNYYLFFLIKKIIYYYFSKMKKLIAELILPKGIINNLKVKGWEKII